jgi:hypothetical protein
VDAAGGVFGAALFVIIKGFGVVVEVFFGPGGLQVALVGPLDAIPAVGPKPNTRVMKCKVAF